MLLGIKIQAPEKFKDLSIGQLLRQMPWETDPALGKSVQDQIRFGEHNSLCLAHGRKPLTEVNISMYSSFIHSSVYARKRRGSRFAP